MAKGGVLRALGNLWRWTVWGLAAVLVVALWLGWSNRNVGPDDTVVAGAEAPTDQDVADLPVTIDEAPEETPAEATEETPPADVESAEGTEQATQPAGEAVENTIAEVQSALEGALGAAGEIEDTVSDVAGQAEAALDDIRDTMEGGTGDEVPATELDEVTMAEGAIGEEEADLNILPPELSNIVIPGDDAVYSLVSVFQRDDGTIEVISDRSLSGETLQTIRLVTCAPLAVGVISEGGAPRNDTPELERIPLGTAAAMIAALACGALN